MADEEEAEAETDGEEDGAPKKGGKKKLIIIAAGVLVLLLGGGAAFFLMSGGEEPPAVAEGGEGGGGAGEVAPSEPVVAATPVLMRLPDILVNISGQQRGSTFLKVGATLQLESSASLPDAEENTPRIIDSFQGFLREMRPSDLAGSAGLLRLKEELLVRSNEALDNAPVRDVLLTELLVQ